jgi:nucleotide-binding universal stress UspA family protein
MKFDIFLNPVDGSDHSRRSTEYAITFAKQFKARIILLHCHNHFPVVLSEPYYQQAMDEIITDSQLLIQPYETLLETAGVEYEIRILEGLPGSSIAKIAEKEAIDMVIMGSRGVSDFQGLFLGSVAHQVLHKCNACPVFIVK